MNSTFLSICFTFFVSTSLFGQKQIRNANWGWSKDSVKKSETLKLISETKDDLLYSGTLANKKFSITYRFTKNKLTQVYYIYSESHINKNNYISNYNDLKSILTKKYGDPIADQVSWKNDLYRDNEDNWGLACSAGHVVFKSIWENPETDIVLVCTGENFDITLGIVYTSKKFKDLMNNEKEQQNDNDF